MNQYKKDFLLSLQNFKQQLSGLDYDRMELYYHHARQLDRIENKPTYILDINAKQFLFVSDKYKYLVGAERNDTSQVDFDFFFNRIHPDDHYITKDVPEDFIQFLCERSNDNIYDYKLVTDFRLRDINGEYVRFLEQIIILQTDDSGKPWLVMAICDLSSNTDATPSSSGKIICVSTGKIIKSYGEISSLDPISKLSNREKEILKLIANGFLSKEIADKLNISINTVNNHRRNILQKTGCNNTFETIKFIEKNGFGIM